jgi:hypothetical protein
MQQTAHRPRSLDRVEERILSEFPPCGAIRSASHTVSDLDATPVGVVDSGSLSPQEEEGSS